MAQCPWGQGGIIYGSYSSGAFNWNPNSNTSQVYLNDAAVTYNPSPQGLLIAKTGSLNYRVHLTANVILASGTIVIQKNGGTIGVVSPAGWTYNFETTLTLNTGDVITAVPGSVNGANLVFLELGVVQANPIMGPDYAVGGTATYAAGQTAVLIPSFTFPESGWHRVNVAITWDSGSPAPTTRYAWEFGAVFGYGTGNFYVPLQFDYNPNGFSSTSTFIMNWDGTGAAALIAGLNGGAFGGTATFTGTVTANYLSPDSPLTYPCGGGGGQGAYLFVA